MTDPEDAVAASTEGPGASRSVRALRAAAVALVWFVGLLPWGLGAPCPAASLTGFPCPGCGMTRAVHLLAAGRFEEGICLHPLAVPSLVATACLAFTSVVVTYRDGSPRAMLDRPGLGPFALGLYAAVTSALLLLWLARCVGLAGGPVPI